MSRTWKTDVTAEADLARVYQAYHGKVLAYAAKRLGRTEADDVAQEVFLKVGRSLGGLVDRSRLAPWIHTIALNTVRDAARRRSRAGDLVTRPPVGPAAMNEDESLLARLPDTASHTPEESLARKEMIACFLGYLRKLPPAWYQVYALSELEELEDAAIARRLGVPLSTVKMRLHRARLRLHHELRRNCHCYGTPRGELLAGPR